MQKEKRKLSETTVSPRSTSFKCSNCSKDDAEQRCSRCTAVKYCSKECQKEHWNSHKVFCKDIKKKMILLEKEAAPLRNFFNKNLFKEEVGNFMRIEQTQLYCQQRFELATAFHVCGMKNNSRLALELAVEHLLDILFLNRGDYLGVRAHIPSMLFMLNEPQEAYDFLKWWQVSHQERYDYYNLDLPYCNLKGEDIFEDMSKLHLGKTHPQWLVSMYMVKYKMFEKIEKDKISYESFLLGTHPRVGEDSPIQQIGGVSVILHSIKKCFSPIDKYETIRNQMLDILKLIDMMNRNIIPGLLNSDTLLRQPNPFYDGRGTQQDQAYAAVYFDAQHWKATPNILIITKELYVQMLGLALAEYNIAELPKESVSPARYHIPMPY